MSIAFDRTGRLVIVPTTLAGPKGARDFRFAVDTASTKTAVTGEILRVLGYREPDATSPRHQVRTGSGGTRAPVIDLSFISALGTVRTKHSVLWLALPPATMIDGLLGLDYFRDQVLTLDFARGTIALGPAKSWWRVWK